MNVAYNQISASDAAKTIGVDYSTVVSWCREGRINSVNVSEGTKNGRYMLSEDEVAYIKTLKQKFGKQFIRKYRKDWKRGMMPAEKAVLEVKPAEPVVKPVATIKSVVVNITKEEPAKSDRIDIDEIAIKIGYIQDIKDKIEKLEQEKLKLMEEYDKLRAEVISAL